MHAKDLCRRSLATCHPDASVSKVAQMMRDQFVEDVIVIDERGRRPVPIGIVTFRDMVVRVVAAQVDPLKATAADIMTSRPETVNESDQIYEVIARMRRERISRVVVVDSHEGLVGVLAADDLTDFLASELTEVARISPHHAALDARAAAKS